MLGSLVRNVLERWVYCYTQRQGKKLFSEAISEHNVRLILGLLKSSFYDVERLDHAPVAAALESIAKVIYGQQLITDDLQTLSLEDADLHPLLEHNKDIVALVLIVTFITTDHLIERATQALPIVTCCNTSPRIETILNAIIHQTFDVIKKRRVLGQGDHNVVSHFNGISEYGLIEYYKQMQCMVKHRPYPHYKQQYDFLTTLSNNTLGGQLVNLLKSSNLSLPGCPGGMASFFLWHDLTHIISGADTSFLGELCANAFTAGSTDQCQLRILTWGLLQFNLGVSLAVIAAPSKNNLKTSADIDFYLQALLSGTRASLDVCDWPVSKIKEDLHIDLVQVRDQYNIQPIDMKRDKEDML